MAQSGHMTENKRRGDFMTIAIVDDTLQDRMTLETMISRYFSDRGEEIQADKFSSAEEFFKSFGPGRYSVIFFDIYMGKMNGMEAALRVRRSDEECRLIFFTSSADHAVDSYKVRADYYLMKPLDYGELCRALERIWKKPDRQIPELSVALKEGINTGIPFDRILYVDCLKRTSRIHTSESVLTAASAFSELAGQLKQDCRFLCCNRSIYVNMDWIQEIEERDVVMKNGEHLPVRVRGKGQVRKEYVRYMLRELRGNDEEK